MSGSQQQRRSPSARGADAVAGVVAQRPNSLAVRMSFVERDLRVSGDPSIYYLTPHYVGHPVVLVADSVST